MAATPGTMLPSYNSLVGELLICGLFVAPAAPEPLHFSLRRSSRFHDILHSVGEDAARERGWNMGLSPGRDGTGPTGGRAGSTAAAGFALAEGGDSAAVTGG